MDKCRPAELCLDTMTEGQRERALHANEVFCKACEERGIRISMWQSFEAWQDYVDGKINETELSEKAKQEVEDLVRSFGKYLVLSKEEHKKSEEETEERKRARRASRIYREICQEAGITVCFFHDFLSWSDFVEGKIDEAEFHNRVKREVREIAARAN